MSSRAALTAHGVVLQAAQTLDEQLHVENHGPGPDSITSPQCSDATDCRYACFASGWLLRRGTSTVNISSAYIGQVSSTVVSRSRLGAECFMFATDWSGLQCDCAVRGFFRGQIDYSHGLQIAARNGLRENFTVTPVRCCKMFFPSRW